MKKIYVYRFKWLKTSNKQSLTEKLPSKKHNYFPKQARSLILCALLLIAKLSNAQTPWIAWYNEVDGTTNKGTYFGTDNDLVIGSNTAEGDYGLGSDPRGYIIASNGYGTGIRIINPITNTVIGSVANPDASGGNFEGIRSWYDRTNEKYYFVASQSGTISGAITNHVCEVWDITNPTAPFLDHYINITWGSTLTSAFCTHIALSSDGASLYGVMGGATDGAWFKITNPFSGSYTATGFTTLKNYNGNASISMPQPHMIALDEVHGLVYILSNKATGLGDILAFNTSNGSAAGIIYQAGSNFTYHGIYLDKACANLYIGREGNSASSVVYRFNITTSANTTSTTSVPATPAATSASTGVAAGASGTGGYVMEVSLTPDENKLYAFTYGGAILELNKSTLALVTTTSATGHIRNVANTADYISNYADTHNEPYLSWDFGDAPASYGIAAHSLSNSFFLNNKLRIGATVDGEGRYFQQNSAGATGDDALNTGSADDEDGSPVVTSNCAASTFTISVPVTNATGGNAYLAGFIDFNQDGDFNDAGEKSTTLTIANGTSGNVTLSFTPASSPCGLSIYLRMRLSTSLSAVAKASDASTSAATAFAPDGEAEDYLLNVPLNVSGSVWDDTNGNAIQNVAEASTNAGGLYANLVDASNHVAASVAVDGAGNYIFTNALVSTSYKIIITNGSQSIGGTLASSSLPVGWANTGVNLSGAANTANQTGIISVTTASTNISNQSFGIDQSPASDTKNYPSVDVNAFTSAQSNGNPTVSGYQGIAANSAALSSYYTSGGSLTGSDPEDCPAASSCNSSSSFYIASITAGTLLYYNGSSVTAGTTISNFNPALLSIYGLLGAPGVSFTYKLVDKAGVKSTLAVSYTISTSFLLALQVTSFTATSINKSVELNWESQSGQGIRNYELWHSTDGGIWNFIGMVNSNDNQISQRYKFTDNTASEGRNYYKLRVINKDLTFSESGIVTAIINENDKTSIYPNPVVSMLTLDNMKGIWQVAICDLEGRLIRTEMINGALRKDINILPLPAGTYIIILLKKEGTVTARAKFIKINTQ